MTASREHPYREPAPGLDPPPDNARLDDRILYGVLAGVGAIPVAITAATQQGFGAEPTIGLGMMIAGAFGLLTTLRK